MKRGKYLKLFVDIPSLFVQMISSSWLKTNGWQNCSPNEINKFTWARRRDVSIHEEEGKNKRRMKLKWKRPKGSEREREEFDGRGFLISFERFPFWSGFRQKGKLYSNSFLRLLPIYIIDCSVSGRNGNEPDKKRWEFVFSSAGFLLWLNFKLWKIWNGFCLGF